MQSVAELEQFIRAFGYTHTTGEFFTLLGSMRFIAFATGSSEIEEFQ